MCALVYRAGGIQYKTQVAKSSKKASLVRGVKFSTELLGVVDL